MTTNITVDLRISLTHTVDCKKEDKDMESYIESLRNQIENDVIEYLSNNAMLVDYVEYNFD